MDNHKVLRASRIGTLCDRALFYSVAGAEKITTEKSRRIFEVGKVLEPVIVSWFRNDGWNVKRNLLDSTNEGMSLSLEVNGGTITAHPYCVISREDSPLILADIKTMNDRSFRSLKRNGIVKSHSQYADQLTIYAQALRECGHNIDQLTIVALNKNNCEGYIDYFTFEPKKYEALKERAERIFACDEAPEQSDRFQSCSCGYCGYSHLCELCKRDTAVGYESVPATDNQEVIDAVELLSKSRDLEKAANRALSPSELAISYSFSTR